MIGIKEQVFGTEGFSAELSLSFEELEKFRSIVTNHWMSVIGVHYPALVSQAEDVGIDNYHLISGELDHKRIWSKANRVLPSRSVEEIKQLPFFNTLKEEFGEFLISDIADTYQHRGEEEIYWRLVRPNVNEDVGELHADKWFHDCFNNGAGLFDDNVITVKVWIPLYCEIGKSGLSIAEGSHRKSINYIKKMIDGSLRPSLDMSSLEGISPKLIPTNPGNMLIFHEKTIHGGVVNTGLKTRISAEITLVLP